MANRRASQSVTKPWAGALVTDPAAVVGSVVRSTQRSVPVGQFERVDEDPGRDHHPNCFSVWAAGGGIKGGQVIG